MASSNDNVSMALFCDFENVALGVRDAKYAKFNIGHVLERLLLKGSIVFIAENSCSDQFFPQPRCGVSKAVGVSGKSSSNDRNRLKTSKTAMWCSSPSQKKIE
jgi:hypothetical protein